MSSYWYEDSIKQKRVEEIYEIGHELSRNPFQIELFSVVCACYDRKTKKSFNVEVIKKKLGYCPDKMSVAILLKLDDINVMRIVEVFETQTYLNVVREYIQGQPLFKHLREGGPYSESKVAHYVKQVLSGLRYLHAHSIIHGCVESDNLIVMNAGDGNVIVKILQSHILPFDLFRSHLMVLPSLCPPEVLLSQITTSAIDMWELALICFITLCGYEPFYRHTETEQFRAVINAKYSFNENTNSTSNAFKDFLNRLLVVDPSSRLNIIEALKHPWLRISTMKNQSLNQIYDDFVKCEAFITERITTKFVNLFTVP